MSSVSDIIATVRKILETVKTAIALGKDAGEIIENALVRLNKDNLTDEDLAAIRQENDELAAKLRQPRPVEPGEEDDT